MNEKQKVFTAPNVYRESSKFPIRFDRLHPGSPFQIKSEPERGIRHSRDKAIYVKARDGFYAERMGDKAGCCLLPNDMVMPVVREKQAK